MHDSHDKISLTCAVDSISLKAYIAGTFKATKGVIAGGIFMTVVQLSCTLINVCNEQNMYTFNCRCIIQSSRTDTHQVQKHYPKFIAR